jgi:predicted naringenin-chalcone synthase
MFVLEQTIHDTTGWKRALVSALGPGFTAGFTLLER